LATGIRQRSPGSEFNAGGNSAHENFKSDENISLLSGCSLSIINDFFCVPAFPDPDIKIYLKGDLNYACPS
jgi:hypothetical protein